MAFNESPSDGFFEGTVVSGSLSAATTRMEPVPVGFSTNQNHHGSRGGDDGKLPDVSQYGPLTDP